MQKLDIRGLKAQARNTLYNTRPDYRRLVTLHSAVSTGVLLLVTLIGFVVGRLDTNTGGLSSMESGAMLNTAQSFFSSAASFLLPFWQVGILFTSLLVVRRQKTDFSMLSQGFRRFGALLRYDILLILIIFGVCIIGTNVMSIYMFIAPPSESLNSAMNAVTISETADAYEILLSMPEEFWSYMIVPMLLLCAVCLVIMIPLLYRLRMSQYAILDSENVGARMAMSISSNLTKGYKWDLFKLEISFWWYYVIQYLLVFIQWIPRLLSAAGLALPLPTDVADLIFYAVYCAASLVLTYFAGAYIETTYAHAYEDLCARQRELTVIPDDPNTPDPML